MRVSTNGVAKGLRRSTTKQWPVEIETDEMQSTATIRIAAVGDIALNGGYHQAACEGKAQDLAATIAPLFAGSDIVLGNLEGPLTTLPSAGPAWRYCLHGDPAYAPALGAAGFHVLSLANNHIMDHGWKGVEETLEHLRAAEIHVVGVGRNLKEARRPLRIAVRGVRIAILAYCDVPVGNPIYACEDKPGIAPAYRRYVLDDIAAARQESDVVIVCMHWGQEHVRVPSPKHRSLAREMIAAGAKIVIGHHPHILQGAELVRGGAIAYSLGNFTFSDEDWSGADERGNAFSMAWRLSETARRTGVWNVVVDSLGTVVNQALIPVYLGTDLFPVCDTRPEVKTEIDQNHAALVRRGYSLWWTIRMIRSRFLAVVEQVRGTRGLGRKLLRLRPEHVRSVWRLLAREWEQMRGME
jgi:hypothetical protein